MIVFSGIDIVVDRSLGRGQIRDAVAASLSVENAKVAVICDVAQYPERGTADVVCVVTRTGGEFAAMISVQCEPNELPFSNLLEVVARLSSSLQARVLAPDEGPDPYSCG